MKSDQPGILRRSGKRLDAAPDSGGVWSANQRGYKHRNPSTGLVAACALLSLAFLGGCHNTLISAAAAGDIWAVRAILEKRPDAMFDVDENGNTAEVFAILKGHNNVAIYLLDQGYPVDGPPGSQPPIMACVSRYTRSSTLMLEILLKRGANPNCYYAKEKWYPIILAVNNYMPDKVRLLAAYGADFGVRDNFGMTPLELAKSRVAIFANPNFDFPHGELQDPAYRQRLIKEWTEMVALVKDLASKQGAGNTAAKKATAE